MQLLYCAFTDIAQALSRENLSECIQQSIRVRFDSRLGALIIAQHQFCAISLLLKETVLHKIHGVNFLVQKV